MTLSASQVIRAIVETLRDGVLPELGGNTWAASNVRACLMVLAYLEERVAREDLTLSADNREMRTLLQEALTATGMPPIDEVSAREIRAVLDTYPSSFTRSVEELTRENQAYREALTGLIRRLFERRDTLEQHLYENFRLQVRSCLAACREREEAIMRGAEGMMPI